MSSSSEFPGFSVRRASWATDREALALVRRQVFVEEQGVPEALEWDAADPGAEHLLACDGERRAIGTARILASGQIGRMAVLVPWRGRGVGTALLTEALRITLQPMRPRPFLHAQASAVPFYLSHGFRAEGPRFDEAGIPHQVMFYQVEP